MVVRIAFLGCGGVARAHMERLKKIEGARLVAFCDPDPERTGWAVQAYGGHAHSDFGTMLKRQRFDALWVCLPPFAHEGQEVLAAEKGIHLFVEKPLALRLETAREVAAAIRKSGVIASVGYLIRYCKHVAEAKRLVRGRRVNLVAGRYLCSMKEMRGWWPVMSKSGGQVLEQSTHTVDLMRYLAGDIRKVFALYAQREMPGRPDWDVPVHSMVAMEFVSGALGTLHSSAAYLVETSDELRLPPGLYPQWADRGVRLGCEELELDCSFGGLRVVKEGETRELRGQDDSMLLEDEAFVSSVARGKPTGILSSYADAIKTLAVTLAANQSAASGQPVECTFS